MVLADSPPRPSREPDARSATPGASGPGARGRRGARGGAAWLDTALLAAALLAALFGLHPLLRGADWWLFGAGEVILVLGVAAVVRLRTGRGALPPFLGALAGALALLVAFAADTAVAGIVPTIATWERVETLVVRGFASIQSQAIPAQAVPGILFLILVPLLLLATIADILVLEARRPALAAVPLLGLLVVPVAVQEGVGDAYAWVIALACYLVLLRSGLPAAPRAASVAAGAVVVLGSLVVPVLLPPTVQDSSVPALGYGVRANPIIDLGSDLRSGASAEVITYSSRKAVQPYLRLATLDDFRGDVWSPDDFRALRTRSLDSIPAAPGLDDEVARTSREIDVHVERIGGRWLPVPYPVVTVTNAVGDWRVDPEGLTVVSDYLSSDGQRFTATYWDLRPTRAQLEASGNERVTGMGRYLEVPSGVDPLVKRTAERVTSGATSNWQRAAMLQEYFRSDFVYSTEAPVSGGYDGAGVGVLGPFLRAKSGYCVHFASAMAVMARQLGIPSRVVVGYLPGTSTGRDGDGNRTYSVDSRELHAWPELYFPGVGWTRFEPTPSLGVVPAYSVAASDDDSVPDPTTSASTEPSTAPSPSSSASSRSDVPEEQNSATGDDASRAVPATFGWLGAALAIVLLALVPAGLRRALRWSRFSRVEGGRDGAAAALAELRDTAADVGWRAPPTETVRDFAARLDSAHPDARDAVQRILLAVETESYARRRGIGVDTDDLRVVVAALDRSVHGRERMRAVLVPPSLVQRARGAVAE